jgi:DNA invertase Pin-like site-specific DNA recombinase
MARKSRKQEATQAVPEIRENEYDTGLYVRLSVLDSGKKDGESIINQQEMLEQYVISCPELRKKSIFVDNGESGVDFFRPAWNDLMSECRAGKINCVLVKDLSRVGRNYIETGEYLDKIFPLLGVRLIAVNDGYDNLNLTSSGQLVANFKNLVNDIYAKDIGRKSAAAIHIKQKNGEFIGARAAYGYQKDPCDKHKLIIDPEAAPIVRQIFNWKADGVSNEQICRRLNNADVPSPARYWLIKGLYKDARFNNCVWQSAIIYPLLSNPVYLGNMAQGKTVGSIYDGRTRSRVKPDDWVTVTKTHESIITQDLWDKAHAVMDERSKRIKEQQGKYAFFEKPEKILKGLVFCADCGHPLTRHKAVTSNGKYCDWVYVCKTHETINLCKKKRIHEVDLNKAVYDAIKLEIQMNCDINGIIRKLTDEKSHKSRLYRYDREIEETESKIKRLVTLRQSVYEDYAAKVITSSEYEYAIEKYSADTKKQKDRLESVKKEKAEYVKCESNVNIWLDTFSRFMELQELTAEMAQILVERVEVGSSNVKLDSGSNVEVFFKFRDEFTAMSKYAEVA